MAEINQEIMDNLITPVIMSILQDNGVNCQMVESKSIYILDESLLLGGSWSVVLTLMFEAISTGYLLGSQNATDCDGNNTPKPSQDGRNL